MTLCSRCATGTRLNLNFDTTLHLVERIKLNQLTVSDDVSASMGAGMFSANLITDELRRNSIGIHCSSVQRILSFRREKAS